MPFQSIRVGFPLSVKLISGFLLVTIPSLALMVAISLHALQNLTGIARQLQEISRSLEAVERLETAVARTVTPVGAYLIGGSADEYQRFQASIREVEAQLRGCNAVACHGNSQQPSAMTEGLAVHVQDLKDRAGVVFGAGKLLTNEDKVRALHEINRGHEEASRLLNRMSSALLLRVASLEDESGEVGQRAAILIVVSVLLILVLAATTAYLLSRPLIKHVDELLEGTRHIMQGDLGFRVAVTQPDEIGQLAQSFNAMAQEIEQHRKHLQRMVEDRTTDLKQAQDSLIQSEKLASIGLLASGVAHELNNPLTSILMNVNLLMEDVGDQPALQAELQRISEDTVRCKRIIDDLRDFSRRQDLELVPTDLNRLVEHVLGLIRHQQDLHGIRVFTEFAERIPLVPCDSARMEQVFVNVVVNAVQAMPHGGSILVKTGLRADFATIFIQDTGPGIPDEIRSRIFDPFFTTKTHGTGLGLSIVYRIMEAHRGRVEVESPVQENPQQGPLRQVGTRILLFLPLTARKDDIGEAASG